MTRRSAARGGYFPPLRAVLSVNREIMQRRAFVICHGSLFICHWPGNRPMNIDLKVENKPGAGAKIALSTTVKNHSHSAEVIDEDGEIIKLDRANRKDVGNAEVNTPSHVQGKGVPPERESTIADHRDQKGAIELQLLSGNASEKMPERSEPAPLFRIVFDLDSKKVILDVHFSVACEAELGKVFAPPVE